jgi:hypothetical protein
LKIVDIWKICIISPKGPRHDVTFKGKRYIESAKVSDFNVTKHEKFIGMVSDSSLN